MELDRSPLVGLDEEDLREVAKSLGQPAYRGRQLSEWIYKKSANDVDGMRDLPADFRQTLSNRYVVNPLVVVSHRKSKDGVDKLLLHSGDDQVFEAVLLPYEDRVSCCLSSQIGCPMGCTFCSTGLGGFDRSLSAGEIVGQYLLLQKLTTRRVSHVVYMGMGEPLLNLEAVIKSIRVLHDSIGLSHRHITVSTVGLVPQIDELAKHKLPIHLALSLHSPIDAVRSRLMPVNNKWPVKEVWAAMRRYQKATGRKVTVEYLLVDDVNDSDDQAEALARLVSGTPCFVNLIPFNHVDTDQGFRRPTRQRVQAFRSVLEVMGVNVTERVERGHDIEAACGQLAGQHQGKFKARGALSALPISSG